MKKLSKLLMAMFFMALAFPKGFAQEIVIELNPGWTWIGYPNAVAMDVATALGDFTPMPGDIINSQYSSTSYNGQRWRGGLTHFMPGWGYMYYSNRDEPVSLVFAGSTTPQSQVQVTTSAPMLITGNSAMGGGEVTTTDGIYILVRGLCWATHENPTTNEDSFVEEGSGVGSFSATMTGLNWSTTYYYRAYAVTPSGTVYGEQQSFTTRDGIPTLTTTDITNITAISATSGGNITDNGGLNITARGVCWSTSPNPTVNDSHTTNGTGTGSFTSSITGLEISTTYYVRAYATTNAGTAYGDEVSFTTHDGIPILTTNDIIDITAISATGGGNIFDDGLSVTARGVCWSTSPNPTVSDSHTTNGTGTGSFTSSITNLEVSTTYYLRAYATTSYGTGYGEQVSFTTQNGIPIVTTTEVTNIQGVVAIGGGNITDNGGLFVIARGVCWSASPSPTLADAHTSDGYGAGSYSSHMTGLSISTTYYVRAYATNSFVTVYGNQLSFTTTNDEHVYVDLGLPSGLLWATCNVGADSPEDYGDYFAWGETQPKTTYNWSTYQYANGTSWQNPQLTKYCNNSSYGYNGFTDNLTSLLPEDDAATSNWGSDWRMPTKEEWQELYQNTTYTWTTQNGVNGSLYTAANGNSLFLPAAGCYEKNNLYYTEYDGRYWSSSLDTVHYDPWAASGWYIYSEACSYFEGCRAYGKSVRAVRSSRQN